MTVGKETDPLAGTPVPDIARETQRARSLALVVLIASTISLIADTLLATLVGGPWGAGGVIGALGASIVLCFRSSRDGNIVYSFFLLAMLCAIIFQCFQLYATVHFWQLWVRAAPLHTSTQRCAPQPPHGRLSSTRIHRLLAIAPNHRLSTPGCAPAPSRPRYFAEKRVQRGDEFRGVAGDRRDRRGARRDRVHRRKLHVHRVLLHLLSRRAMGDPTRRARAQRDHPRNGRVTSPVTLGSILKVGFFWARVVMF